MIIRQDETIKAPTAPYIPTAAEIVARDKSYGYLKDMLDLKDQAMPHFSGPEGERSWNDMVDDSEMILNGYTESREAQGKEAWQSNMMDKESRVKMKAIASGVGLSVPKMNFGATNKNGIRSAVRADIFKNTTQKTFNDGNPKLSAFKETWHMLAHGVVFEYEGYKTGGAMRDRVESFDSLTGEVTTKKEYVKMDGKPFNVLINPQEFYWWTFFVNDVQEQPRIAWVQHYTKGDLEIEFSKYKNYGAIKDKKEAAQISQLQESIFFEEWSERVEDENDYEVFRLYDKERDLYEVWINGIPMLQTPILWGDEEKMYPFAVQVGEYYANTNFFVGMPFGQIVESVIETKNTTSNTLVDKLYRSMKKPFLYGLNNKDLFDIEDQFVDEDNKHYVPDINQVKPFPYEGPNQGEFAMLSVLDRTLNKLTVDEAQQGQAVGGKRTARESVIADARSQEIKAALYLGLENLWLQKYRLRTQVILTHYIKDTAASKEIKGQIISIEDYTFGDGERGILDIHIAKSKGTRMSQDELNSRAEAMEAQGMAYKIISIESSYLNDWKYDFSIIPDSFHQKEQALEEAQFDAEVEYVVTLAPEFYEANKEKYLKEKLAFRGKQIDEFNKPQPPEPKTLPDGTPLPDDLQDGEPEGGGGASAFDEGDAILTK